MPQILLSRDLQHEQVEFPADMPHPKGRRGGGKGSLHIRRGSVRDVTAEELEFIRVTRPELYRCLDVLPAPKASRALERSVASRKRAASAAKKAPKPKAPAKSPAKPPKAKTGGSQGKTGG